MQTLDTLDWVFIGVYFLILAGIAVWIIRNKKKRIQKIISWPVEMLAGLWWEHQSSLPISGLSTW